MSLSNVIRAVLSPASTEAAGATAPTAVIDLSALRALKRRAEDGIEELAKIEVIAKESQAVIDEVLADGRIDSEREQSRLMHARLKLDLVPARRKKLLADQPKLAGEIVSELRDCGSRWSKSVQVAREAMWSRIVETNAPYFASMPRKHIFRALQRIEWPVFDAFRKANFSGGAEACRGDLPALIALADDLISRSQRYNRLLNLGLEIK